MSATVVSEPAVEQSLAVYSRKFHRGVLLVNPDNGRTGWTLNGENWIHCIFVKDTNYTGWLTIEHYREYDKKKRQERSIRNRYSLKVLNKIRRAKQLRSGSYENLPSGGWVVY